MPLFGAKLFSDILPWTLFVPRSEWFSKSEALRKLWTSDNRWCRRTYKSTHDAKWMHLFSLSLFSLLLCAEQNDHIENRCWLSTATSITIKLFLSQTNLSLNTLQLKSTLKERLSSHCKQCFKIREYHRGKGIFDHAQHLNQSRVNENVCKYRYLPKKVRNTQLPQR